MTDPHRLDDLLDDFGDRLKHAEPPRRRAPVLAGAGAALAAVALALVLVLSGSPGTKPADALAAARAALEPKGEIVHFRINAGRATQEQWLTADPSRYRFIQRSRPSTYEYAVDGDTWTTYYPGRKQLVVRHGAAPNPGMRGLGSDPTVAIQKALADGELRDVGLVMQDGRQVRRFAGSDGKLHTTYDIDPETSAPLRIAYRVEETRRKPDGSKLFPDFRMVYTIDRYERLPDTPENAKVLEIHPPAGTEVIQRGR